MVNCCNEHKILFMSTPFDKDNVDFLEKLGIAVYKIASCDITNIPFLKYVAKNNKPMIISTGTANIAEIQEAVDAIYSTGNKNIILLHCTLCYPTDFKDVNLRMMQEMMKVFSDIPIGLSDHSLGTVVPLAAVALGAKVIEKHYTINKKLMLSADHWLSVDDKELKEMVDLKDKILAAMGQPKKEKIPCEEPTYKYARRSIVSTCCIKKGTRITEEMLELKRPGTGIAPKYLDIFLGKITQRDIKDDSLISWEDITQS
jgi:N,N'-diacetyllegionaminate synthase